MIVFLFLLFILLLWNATIKATNPDYLNRSQTDAIKGFFILMVFLSHIRGYIPNVGGSYPYFDWFLSKVGQRMVAMFLFYSGYGVMEALQHRPRYLDTFLNRRFFSSWFHFALGLIPFLIMNLTMGFSYPLRSYILCWTGWESIGNSNWYIFDILVLYLLTWVVFRLGGKLSFRQKTTMMFLVSGLFVLILKATKQGTYWYNTVLCFPLGMLISLNKEKMEKVLLKPQRWLLASSATAILFFGSYFVNNFIFYTFNTWCFCLAIVFLSMCMRVGNPALDWCGRHLFPLYILQRIPMKALSNAVPNISPILLTALSLGLTLALAAGFQRLTFKVDHLLKHAARGTD